MKAELEVIAFDLQSCIVAERAGADRIELCANPQEGGTTPSYGMMVSARERTRIQLFPIIRPRGGDFLYSDEELQCMIEDIQVAERIGCDGVVIGMLNPDGSIDKSRCQQLMAAAGNMEVTFHRAFDRVKDPFAALEAVIELGCKRILTSGLRPTVTEGAYMLKALVTQAGERIKIMPGSGVRAENIIALAEATGAFCFHSSARTTVKSTMHYKNEEMNEALEQITLMENEVRDLRRLIDSFFETK